MLKQLTKCWLFIFFITGTFSKIGYSFSTYYLPGTNTVNAIAYNPNDDTIYLAGVTYTGFDGESSPNMNSYGENFLTKMHRNGTRLYNWFWGEAKRDQVDELLYDEENDVLYVAGYGMPTDTTYYSYLYKIDPYTLKSLSPVSQWDQETAQLIKDRFFGVSTYQSLDLHVVGIGLTKNYIVLSNPTKYAFFDRKTFALVSTKATQDTACTVAGDYLLDYIMLGLPQKSYIGYFDKNGNFIGSRGVPLPFQPVQLAVSRIDDVWYVGSASASIFNQPFGGYLMMAVVTQGFNYSMTARLFGDNNMNYGLANTYSPWHNGSLNIGFYYPAMRILITVHDQSGEMTNYFFHDTNTNEQPSAIVSSPVNGDIFFCGNNMASGGAFFKWGSPYELPPPPPPPPPVTVIVWQNVPAPPSKPKTVYVNGQPVIHYVNGTQQRVIINGTYTYYVTTNETTDGSNVTYESVISNPAQSTDLFSILPRGFLIFLVVACIVIPIFMISACYLYSKKMKEQEKKLREKRRKKRKEDANLSEADLLAKQERRRKAKERKAQMQKEKEEQDKNEANMVYQEAEQYMHQTVMSPDGSTQIIQDPRNFDSALTSTQMNSTMTSRTVAMTQVGNYGLSNTQLNGTQTIPIDYSNYSAGHTFIAEDSVNDDPRKRTYVEP